MTNTSRSAQTAEPQSIPSPVTLRRPRNAASATSTEGAQYAVPVLSGATAVRPDSLADADELEHRLLRAFASAGSEVFEDGVENSISREIERAIRVYGNRTIRAIAGLHMTGHIPPALFAEALRWIGQADHGESADERFYLITNSLFSLSAGVRDAAAIALSSLGDPRGIPALGMAKRIEPFALILSRIDDAMADLRA